MEILVQITGLAVIGAVLCLVVRTYSGVLSGLVALAACVMVLAVSLRLLEPILDILKTIRELTGLSSAVTAPLYKAVGIGVLTQISGAVCEDAGERSLAKAVEIGGSILSLYVSVPLLSSVLEMLRDAMGG